MADDRPHRDAMIAGFWNDVCRRLIGHHNRPAVEAAAGIDHYRWDTERRQLGEAVYNQGVERTAEVVEGIIQCGIPEGDFRPPEKFRRDR
jgi:hypothetical protein